MKFLLFALVAFLPGICSAQDDLSILKKYYYTKNIDKMQKLVFNGDVTSVKQRSDKLFTITMHSPTTNETKIFISTSDITKKTTVGEKMMQVEYKTLRNLKTKKSELIITRSMPLANF